MIDNVNEDFILDKVDFMKALDVYVSELTGGEYDASSCSKEMLEQYSDDFFDFIYHKIGSNSISRTMVVDVLNVAEIPLIREVLIISNSEFQSLKEFLHNLNKELLHTAHLGIGKDMLQKTNVVGSKSQLIANLFNYESVSLPEVLMDSIYSVLYTAFDYHYNNYMQVDGEYQKVEIMMLFYRDIFDIYTSYVNSISDYVFKIQFKEYSGG
jgi:hypothetical protein